jgi:hypothetical protein
MPATSHRRLTTYLYGLILFKTPNPTGRPSRLRRTSPPFHRDPPVGIMRRRHGSRRSRVYSQSGFAASQWCTMTVVDALAEHQIWLRELRK